MCSFVFVCAAGLEGFWTPSRPRADRPCIRTMEGRCSSGSGRTASAERFSKESRRSKRVLRGTNRNKIGGCHEFVYFKPNLALPYENQQVGQLLRFCMSALRWWTLLPGRGYSLALCRPGQSYPIGWCSPKPPHGQRSSCVEFRWFSRFGVALQRAADVQFTENVVTLLTTNAPPEDSLLCSDPNPPEGAAFYRLLRR